mmetsp:Transcript_697/g.856  ORF Transcript_697/g.856 Transcript_697/m.856 type:complete len:138 (+) Transcript_697:14-427(+)
MWLVKVKLLVDPGTANPKADSLLLKSYLHLSIEADDPKVIHLLAAIFSEVKVLVNKQKYPLTNLALSTNDGFLFPPNLRVSELGQAQRQDDGSRTLEITHPIRLFGIKESAPSTKPQGKTSQVEAVKKEKARVGLFG